jgi:hypothetical protein
MHVAAGGVGNAEPAKSDAAEGVVRAHGLPTTGLKPELMARLLVVLCT